MFDLRKKASMPVKGHLITAGYEVNEDTVKEILTTMGVEADDATVQDAVGYFSSNSMEINMNNLYDYLKGKQILSSVKDKRLKKK
jgi:hypothetical protein